MDIITLLTWNDSIAQNSSHLDSSQSFIASFYQQTESVGHRTLLKWDAWSFFWSLLIEVCPTNFEGFQYLLF